MPILTENPDASIPRFVISWLNRVDDSCLHATIPRDVWGKITGTTYSGRDGHFYSYVPRKTLKNYLGQVVSFSVAIL
jgi:hypothetical protein